MIALCLDMYHIHEIAASPPPQARAKKYRARRRKKLSPPPFTVLFQLPFVTYKPVRCPWFRFPNSCP